MTPAAAWFRVSTGHQTTANQVPDVERFAGHHGYEIGLRYEISDSAWIMSAWMLLSLAPGEAQSKSFGVFAAMNKL